MAQQVKKKGPGRPPNSGGKKPGPIPGGEKDAAAPSAVPAGASTPSVPTWPPGSRKPAGAAAATNRPKMTVEQAMAELWRWHQLKEHIAATVKPLIEQEMDMRRGLFEFFFGPQPKEGTTRLELKDGWSLKAVYDFDRKLDEASMDAVFAKLPDGSRDWLVRNKPELVVKVYKDMPDNLRKVLDECVICKPKVPTLELIVPKA